MHTGLAAFQAADIDIVVRGTGWPGGRVAQATAIEAMSRSRICLNLSNASTATQEGLAQQIKGRHFEIPACGALQLTDAVAGLDEYFAPGREVVVADPDDLVSQARYYLAHDDERAAIAKAGHARVIAEHTYERRFADIFATMCARDPKASGWLTARRETAVSGDVVTASHHARIGYPMTSIIILNHNGRKHVEVCLASIAALTDVPYELIVIDNGSTDGSVEYLRSVEAASMTLIENPENIGCPPARAQGMCLARGDYVLFLDNDTHVTPGWLRRLVEHCEDNPDVGVLGPTTNYAGGPQQLPQAEVTYSDTDSLAVFATDLAKRLRGSLVSRRRIIGFCMLIRRAVVDRVGNCDGRFGKYGYEDDDYCWRALLAGYQVGIARDVFIHHVGGQGSPGGADDYDEMLPVAWAEFRDKWDLPETMDPDGYWTLISTYGLHRTFDPERDYIPLPDPSSVADLITRTPTR